MEENKKEEINNFLLELMKSNEGKEIMEQASKQLLVQPAPPVIEKVEPIAVEKVEPPPIQKVSVEQPEETNKETSKKNKETWWGKRFNKNRLNKGSKVAIVV